jgi:hypothetical protein
VGAEWHRIAIGNQLEHPSLQATGFLLLVSRWRPYIGENVKNLILFDERQPLCVQANEVSAILAIFTAHAGFNTEKIRVYAIGAFSQRNTNFRNGYVAGIANRKKVFADHIILAVLAIVISLNRTVDSATHENVRMGFRVLFYLLEALIHPMDTVFAEEHGL